MILGNVCTRDCRFCAVRHGKPDPVDQEEAQRVAEAVKRLRVRHAVVTSVTRDDLPDGGAAHFAATVRAIRAVNPHATVEVLVPDFDADPQAIACVLGARPDVLGHNIETVDRLYAELRGADHSYTRALDVLWTAHAQSPETLIKSAFMLGHGETKEEVLRTLRDLLDAGCVAVCMGQYLQPTPQQVDVTAFVPPEQFEAYEDEARRLGFRAVWAAPFVRSSYRSGELLDALRGSQRSTWASTRTARCEMPLLLRE